MNIYQNHSLKNFNTFGIEVQAQYFAEFSDLDTLKVLLSQFSAYPKLLLGGGSNILLTRDFEGIVLRNKLMGIEKISEDENHVRLKVGAGENWHQFVLFCLNHQYAGVENLSLIPGTVGAAPLQNIGAYGVEVKEIIEQVEALRISDLQRVVFDNAECKFAYRESIFKHEAKGQYILTSVTFTLSKKPHFNISYGAIQQTLDEMGIQELSIQAISRAVCHIRQTKLPDPAQIGNAGSFFKNPEIPLAQFEQLQKKYTQIPSYPVNAHTVKVPAGWLIDQAGWKGKRFGQIGVHAQQALVLVNYGGGQGSEIWKLAQEIQKSILDIYGIEIQPEINII
ncbi:MAG: UDP-N-acetylmuramate dehydrogenase [Microscillaceae bacterium]|nr:UDP-N-acetylmuramate dehydrogenase [Microscillaceae bacterium]